MYSGIAVRASYRQLPPTDNTDFRRIRTGEHQRQQNSNMKSLYEQDTELCALIVPASLSLYHTRPHTAATEEQKTYNKNGWSLQQSSHKQ